MKIAKNSCYGGFSVSDKAALRLRELGVRITLPGERYHDGSIRGKGFGLPRGSNHLDNEDFGIKNEDYNAYRADHRLIAVIEELGEKEASGALANIRVVTIPDDTEWEITEYDGMETVREKRETW